jgi:hypothetical protein
MYPPPLPPEPPPRLKWAKIAVNDTLTVSPPIKIQIGKGKQINYLLKYIVQKKEQHKSEFYFT